MLGLSLPFAVFTARTFEALQPHAVPRAVAVGLVALAWGGALAHNVEGWARPRRADAPATGAVHYAFGEYDDARRIYARLLEGSRGGLPWLESLAAVELAGGHEARGLALARRAVERAGDGDPLRVGRLAVALALDGQLEAAGRTLDAAIETEPLPELRANRGVVSAARRELARAREDLRSATRDNPELFIAWHNLALVETRLGDVAAAARARQRAAEFACRAPRGFPYGLGTGEIVEWGVGRRPLLLLEAGEDGADAGLLLATPPFYAAACRTLRAAARG